MIEPREIKGLTAEEVKRHIENGKYNKQPKSLTPTVGKIILKNTLTLFNLLNFAIAFALILIGEWKNSMFVGIALCNMVMGIFQELRAKKTLDKLAILARSKVAVVRNGEQTLIDQEEVVIDDIICLTTGNQICADSEVICSEGLEVDESLLTGEPDKIVKREGDTVMSGSFAVAGRAFIKVKAVGSDNYATALTVEAKKEKSSSSQLMRTINNIIRVLTIVIIPVGVLLFMSKYTDGYSIADSIRSTAPAIIGMIPEGLILLTGVTMTVGALKLAKRKALVQSLPSIETLARVDVLCLDKTGTITDGTLGFQKFILPDGAKEEEIKYIIAELSGALEDNNATAIALSETFGSHKKWKPLVKTPFSSARKWSGVSFAEKGTYILGAPAFVFPEKNQPFFKTVSEYAGQGFRVLCLAFSPENMNDGEGQLPGNLRCTALLIMSDNIRKEAPDTFRFFADEGVTLKVISGDDPLTVSIIASRAGIAEAGKYIDMSELDENGDFQEIVEEYVVFGRVSPQQKKALIKAIKKNGHTACMTGDGVNDVLAMKEADCSVAMINGSDAARSASDFVLMTSDFSAMVMVLQEGRQVINNIETVSALYLVKTIYSTMLSFIYMFIPHPYPFDPIQMMPINSLAVAIPSFFLALRKNIRKPEGKFLKNVLENSLPAALVVVLSIVYLQMAGILFQLPKKEISTMCVLVTGIIGFSLLYKISKPIDWKIKGLFILLISVFLLSFIVPISRNFIGFDGVLTRNIYFYIPLIYAGPQFFYTLSAFVNKIGSREKKIKNKIKSKIKIRRKKR